MPWHQEPTKDVTSCDKLRGCLLYTSRGIAGIMLEELKAALEEKGYHFTYDDALVDYLAVSYTHLLHVLRYQAADLVVLAAFVALAAGLIVLKHMGI